MEKCPNCGSEDTRWHNAFTDNGLRMRHCRECGTQWQEDYPQGATVPRRSQPVEPVEMPTEDGYWWNRFIGSPVWHCDYFSVGSPREEADCEYIRAVPPIVKPKPKDADVEMLRHAADQLRRGNVGWLKAEDLNRIAARLDAMREWHISYDPGRLESEGKHE